MYVLGITRCDNTVVFRLYPLNRPIYVKPSRCRHF